MAGSSAMTWPAAVSDGLALPCSDCGDSPRFDYRVRDTFWQQWVPGPERLSVVCLPCLDRRCGGVGLADALIEVQFTGTGHTVVLSPVLRHEYGVRTEILVLDGERMSREPERYRLDGRARVR